MDVNSPCALLQTKLRARPVDSMFTQSRNKPLQILSVITGVITLMIVVTVIISTVMFMRNKKSNRILPNRRVRRRPRQQQQHVWALRNPFKKPQNPGERFQVTEEEPEPQVITENVNTNNNVRPPPPPPSAPALPPPPPLCPPADRRGAVPTVPTVSATVAPRAKRKPAAMSRRDTVNKALVSELKMRLEQKRMMRHY